MVRGGCPGAALCLGAARRTRPDFTPPAAVGATACTRPCPHAPQTARRPGGCSTPDPLHASAHLLHRHGALVGGRVVRLAGGLQLQAVRAAHQPVHALDGVQLRQHAGDGGVGHKAASCQADDRGRKLALRAQRAVGAGQLHRPQQLHVVPLLVGRHAVRWPRRGVAASDFNVESNRPSRSGMPDGAWETRCGAAAQRKSGAPDGPCLAPLWHAAVAWVGPRKLHVGKIHGVEERSPKRKIRFPRPAPSTEACVCAHAGSSAAA